MCGRVHRAKRRKGEEESEARLGGDGMNDPQRSAEQAPLAPRPFPLQPAAPSQRKGNVRLF